MAHYAQVVNGIVQKVIVAESAFISGLSNANQWIQTSYNTRSGVHLGSNGQPESGTALRGNYATIGSIYDSTHDVFYAPQPFPSWTLNMSIWQWNAPTPRPTTGGPYS